MYRIFSRLIENSSNGNELPISVPSEVDSISLPLIIFVSLLPQTHRNRVGSTKIHLLLYTITVITSFFFLVFTMA